MAEKPYCKTVFASISLSVWSGEDDKMMPLLPGLVGEGSHHKATTQKHAWVNRWVFRCALKANRPGSGSAGPWEGAHSRVLFLSLRIPCPWVPRLQAFSSFMSGTMEESQKSWRNHRKEGSWGEHISVLPGCLDKSRHLLGQLHPEPAMSSLHRCKDLPRKGEGFCKYHCYLIHSTTWESMSCVLCCHCSSICFTLKFKKEKDTLSTCSSIYRTDSAHSGNKVIVGFDY